MRFYGDANTLKLSKRHMIINKSQLLLIYDSVLMIAPSVNNKSQNGAKCQSNNLLLNNISFQSLSIVQNSIKLQSIQIYRLKTIIKQNFHDCSSNCWCLLNAMSTTSSSKVDIFMKRVISNYGILIPCIVIIKSTPSRFDLKQKKKGFCIIRLLYPTKFYLYVFKAFCTISYHRPNFFIKKVIINIIIGNIRFFLFTCRRPAT